MAVRAYVLIDASIGKTNSIVAALRQLPEAVRTDLTTGPHDVICMVEVDTPEKVGTLVRERIHNIEGIAKTMTCVSLKT